MLTTRVLLVAGLVLVAGCSGDPEAAPAPAPRTSVSEVAQPSAPATSETARPTAREIVDDSDARLYAVDVTRSGRAFHVASMWSLDRRRARRYAVAESDDGFRGGRYITGGSRRLQRAVQSRVPAGAGRHGENARIGLGRLLPWPVNSLADNVLAVAGGGDGATLFPFQRVVRSTDGGAFWARFDVPLFEGEMAYSSGQVVTPDGRLVALLDHFSDDRPDHPSERHHGLWSSDGTDWSSYRPLSSRVTPPLEQSPSGWPAIVSIGASADPDPLIWITTWDHRLYVSTDGARTFEEIPAR